MISLKHSMNDKLKIILKKLSNTNFSTGFTWTELLSIPEVQYQLKLICRLNQILNNNEK